MSKHPISDQATTATLPLNRRQLITGAVTLAGGLALARHAPAVNAAENVAGRLQALGIQLPEPPAPVANYVAYLVQDNFAYIAGQIPFANGELLFPGSVPTEVSVDAARIAARQCGINILAALSGACEGNLDRVRQCMRLDGYVASADGFTQQPQVINAASDLMVEVFGEAGRHTRTAVGVNELPLNACVEISAVFVID